MTPDQSASSPQGTYPVEVLPVHVLVALLGWISIAGLVLRLFNRLETGLLYCIGYIGFLLVSEWAFSNNLRQPWRRVLGVGIIVSSVGFLAVIIFYIMQLSR